MKTILQMKTKSVCMAFCLLSLSMFAGCSHDNDPADRGGLESTTWKATFAYEYDDVVTFTLSFQKSTFISIVEWDDDGIQTETTTGFYTYNPPEVVLTGDGETLTGIVSGNKMTFVMEEGETITFTKQ
jgi:hypothetical protein